MSSPPDRLSNGLLAAAIISGIILCIPALHDHPLALDEHVSYFAAGAPTTAELCRRSLDVMATPPLSHLIERSSLSVFGHSERVLRLPSLVAYVASILVVFFAGRRISSPLAGALAALVLAWHPEVLDEVRIGRCYGLELLLAAASIWALVRWLQGPPSVGNSALWVLFAVGLLWTHYLSAPLVAIEGGVALLSCLTNRAERGSRFLLVLVMLAITALAAIPLAPALRRLSEWSPALNYRGTTVSWWELIGVPWTGSVVVAAVLAACLSLVSSLRGTELRSNFPDRRWLLVVIALWLVPLATLIAAALINNPTLANVRYRIPLAPASALVLSVALVKQVRPLAAVTVAAGALVASWSFGPQTPFQAGRLGAPSDLAWKQVGLDLADELARNDTLVFTQTGLTEGFLVSLYPEDERLQKYVACRLGAFYTGSEKAWSLPLIWSQDEFANVCRRRLRAPEVTRVIVVAAMDTDLNRTSVDLFDGLARGEGFEREPASVETEPTVIRYQRRK